MAKTKSAKRPRAERTARGAPSYDAPKEFEGKRYTGMRVGRAHRWNYDAGAWRERKVTPDEWTFTYEVPKRRAGRAPEGSGAPVGTEYRWFVLADQFVKKLDANRYSTRMEGLKVKLAHKRADRTAWSPSAAAQRRHLLAALRALIVRLEGDELVAGGVAPPRPARKARKARAGVSRH